MPSNKNGFTLLELLIAMAIVTLMGIITINSLPSGRRKAKDTVIRTDINQYQNSLEQYANSNSGLYPTGGSTLGAPVICSQLNTDACESPDADNYKYIVAPSRSAYYIYTKLQNEDKHGNVNYFVACSSGVRGEMVTEPSGDDCPL